MTNATAQRTVTSSPGVGVELEPEVVLFDGGAPVGEVECVSGERVCEVWPRDRAVLNRLADAFAALRADCAANSLQGHGKSLEPFHSTFAETQLEAPPLLVAGL